MHTQTLLATVSDRQVAELLADIYWEVTTLQRRVTALENSATQPDADPASVWFPTASDASAHLGIAADSEDGPDLLALTLGGKAAALLVAADFSSLAAVRAANDAQLRPVVGARSLRVIRAQLAAQSGEADAKEA